MNAAHNQNGSSCIVASVRVQRQTFRSFRQRCARPRGHRKSRNTRYTFNTARSVTSKRASSAASLRWMPSRKRAAAAPFGTLPIAFGISASGTSRQPLGLAVVGGLVVSQLLTLYLTPVFYWTFEGVDREAACKRNCADIRFAADLVLMPLADHSSRTKRTLKAKVGIHSRMVESSDAVIATPTLRSLRPRRRLDQCASCAATNFG